MIETVDAWLLYFRSAPWDQIRSLFELLLWFLAVVAVLGCLLRLGTIRAIIGEYLSARSRIWDLRNTVDDLKDLEPTIKQLMTDMPLMIEKIDAIKQQAFKFQTDTMSTRIEAADEAPSAASISPEADALAGVSPEERNWQALRELWRRNTQRLEYKINQIEDGRKKVAYDRLPRTNWDRIVDRLQSQGQITVAAANASRSLNEVFNGYRPRNRTIPDAVIGSLRILDEQLDRELVAYKKVIAAEEAADLVPDLNGSLTPSTSRPPQPGNRSRSGQEIPGQR